MTTKTLDEKLVAVHIKRFQFEHYRVPAWLWDCARDIGQTKGKPGVNMLYHYRRGVDVWMPAGRGGMTVCHIELYDGRRYSASALCSLSDNFCYAKGNDLSLERALDAALEHRETP